MSDFFEDFGGSEQAEYVPASSIRAQKKKRTKGRALAIAAVLGLVVAGLVAVMPNPRTLVSAGDYEGDGKGSVEIVIPEGASGTQIASILAEANVVKTDRAFINEFNADSRAASIQPGTYIMKEEMSAASALAILINPASKSQIKVTIPEGFTKQQVFERVAQTFNASVDDVKAIASDASKIGLPSQAGGDPEGWFAPLTYNFEPSTTVEQALAEMVSTRLKQLQDLGVSLDQAEDILIKASIIEREALAADDYPKVARVIENRLVDRDNVNGRLQMDSTVLYGLGKSGGSPTQAELDQDTPYNTYKRAGLTPTPIGNPGETAIKAAKNPADGTWLYFVTVNLDTGETKFATTLAEHEKNINEYRQWAANNPQ